MKTFSYKRCYPISRSSGCVIHKGEPYLSEIIVPLLRIQQSPPSAPAKAQPAQSLYSSASGQILSLAERREAPGSLWTYLKLYLSTHQQNELISGPLRQIVQQLREQGLCDYWFYIRYYDPEPHLRIRFHASDQERSKEVLIQAVTWGQRLAQRGLIGRFCVDTYEREIERYGGPQAIDYLEQVFSADSDVVSSLIASHHQQQLTLDLIAVAVMSLDALIAAWGLTLEQRVQHSQHLTQKYHFADEFREQRKLLCELLAPWDIRYDPVVQQQRKHVYTLFAKHYTALPSIAQTISILAEQGVLKQPQEAMLHSLAHMHINRLLGVNREQESKVYAFWHNTLKSIILRPSVHPRMNGKGEPEHQAQEIIRL